MPRASDIAYDALRDSILQGEYAVGDRLAEETIAHQLGISRTPVREALRRLDADGLVSLRARRGALVAHSVDRELSETYALRALLEGLGASLAAERVTGRQLDYLAKLCDDMERSVQQGDGAYPALNIEFHREIASASGSDWLVKQVTALTQASLISTAYERLRQEHVSRSLHHHRELVTALQHRDPTWAEVLMKAHIYAARAAIKSGWDADSDLALDRPPDDAGEP